MSQSAYLCGAISSVPDAAVQFGAAASVLRGEGWLVTNPAEHPLSAECWAESRDLGATYRDGPIYRQLMREFYRTIVGVQRLYVLPGWERAGGAVSEVFVARRTGVPVWEYDLWPSQRHEIWPEMLLAMDPRFGVGAWERVGARSYRGEGVVHAY